MFKTRYSQIKLNCSKYLYCLWDKFMAMLILTNANTQDMILDLMHADICCYLMVAGLVKT